MDNLYYPVEITGLYTYKTEMSVNLIYIKGLTQGATNFPISNGYFLFNSGAVGSSNNPMPSFISNNITPLSFSITAGSTQTSDEWAGDENTAADAARDAATSYCMANFSYWKSILASATFKDVFGSFGPGDVYSYTGSSNAPINDFSFPAGSRGLGVSTTYRVNFNACTDYTKFGPAR